MSFYTINYLFSSLIAKELYRRGEQSMVIEWMIDFKKNKEMDILKKILLMSFMVLSLVTTGLANDYKTVNKSSIDKIAYMQVDIKPGG